MFNDKDAADYNLIVEPRGTYSGGVLRFGTKTSELDRHPVHVVVARGSEVQDADQDELFELAEAFAGHG